MPRRSALFEHHGLAIDDYDEFYIGHIYQMGYSVGPYNQPDCAQAASWYRRAAARGSALAQNSLGDLYNPDIDKHNCAGLPEQSYDGAARDWYAQAAKGGQVYAQRRLGEMYKAGLGLHGTGEPELAIYYLREAAERGDAVALTHLGEIYSMALTECRIGSGLMPGSSWRPRRRARRARSERRPARETPPEAT